MHAVTVASAVNRSWRLPKLRRRILSRDQCGDAIRERWGSLLWHGAFFSLEPVRTLCGYHSMIELDPYINCMRSRENRAIGQAPFHWVPLWHLKVSMQTHDPDIDPTHPDKS